MLALAALGLQSSAAEFSERGAWSQASDLHAASTLYGVNIALDSTTQLAGTITAEYILSGIPGTTYTVQGLIEGPASRDTLLTTPRNLITNITTGNVEFVQSFAPDEEDGTYIASIRVIDQLGAFLDQGGFVLIERKSGMVSVDKWSPGKHDLLDGPQRCQPVPNMVVTLPSNRVIGPRIPCLADGGLICEDSCIATATACTSYRITATFSGPSGPLASTGFSVYEVNDADTSVPTRHVDTDASGTISFDYTPTSKKTHFGVHTWSTTYEINLGDGGGQEVPVGNPFGEIWLTSDYDKDDDNCEIALGNTDLHGTPWAVWQANLLAQTQILELMNDMAPYEVHVYWPVNATGSYYSRHLQKIALTDDADVHTIQHELGHALMDWLYPGWPVDANGNQIPADTRNCNPHHPGQSSSIYCAWTEGFAEFVEIILPDGLPSYWFSNPEDPGETSNAAMDEGNIARSLYDLVDAGVDVISGPADGCERAEVSFFAIMGRIQAQQPNHFEDFVRTWGNGAEGQRTWEALAVSYPNGMTFDGDNPTGTFEKPEPGSYYVNGEPQIGIGAFGPAALIFTEAAQQPFSMAGLADASALEVCKVTLYEENVSEARAEEFLPGEQATMWVEYDQSYAFNERRTMTFRIADFSGNSVDVEREVHFNGSPLLPL